MTSTSLDARTSIGVFANGAPSYFGSYREVFARDLYEAFTGLLVDGDLATARAATRFLFDRQQQADGSMPRNSLLNGETAPDTGGTQLDETSYPIVMALQAGLGGNGALWRDHIRPAADFLVAHGPSFGVERWEEQTGYSPSTIAAEICATRELTGRPFGVNLITLHPDLLELIDICAEHRVGHVVLAGGLPSSAAVSRIKQSGARVFCSSELESALHCGRSASALMDGSSR